MIKNKKHVIGDFFSNLVQARDTFIQYWIESQPDIEDEIFNFIVNDLNAKLFENDNFEKFYTKAANLDKYKSLHTAEYELESDGTLPKQAYCGVIVVAIDPKDPNKNLILDGNHRKNTLLRLCPQQDVLVIEVKAQLPELI